MRKSKGIKHAGVSHSASRGKRKDWESREAHWDYITKRFYDESTNRWKVN